MSDITLSKAVRSNLLSLQSTATMMGKTQERLATGLKVNSALDNPTNFFTASSLNSRASDLGQLLDSVSNAVTTIAAADKGISAITKLVETAQATARQALQTPATVDSTTAATAGSITGGTFASMDFTTTAATAGSITATFGSAMTFDGDDALTFDIAIDGDPAQSISIAQSDVQGVGNSDSVIDDADELVELLNAKITGATATNNAGTITITSDSTGASSSVVISSTGVTDTNTSGFTNTSGIADGSGTAGQAAGAAKTLSFDVTVDGGSSQTVTINIAAVQAVGNSDGVIDSVAELASIVDAQLDATVTVDGTGASLVLSSATTGTTSSVAIANTTATNVTNTSGIADASDSGTAASTTSGANPKREELREQYNELLGQIDELVKDAGFNGVNLLDGDDLSVLFNEDGSSKLDIAGVELDSTGLGLSTISANGFDNDAAINSTLDALKSGIDTLRTQASKFGANLSVVETRQDFTKNMINVLETGAANLTLADTNEEAANLLALQTRQQLSSTALSLASQADQNVLRLF